MQKNLPLPDSILTLLMKHHKEKDSFRLVCERKNDTRFQHQHPQGSSEARRGSLRVKIGRSVASCWGNLGQIEDIVTWQEATM